MTLSFMELVRVFPVAGKSGLCLSFKHVGFIVSYYVKVEKHYVLQYYSITVLQYYVLQYYII